MDYDGIIFPAWASYCEISSDIYVPETREADMLFTNPVKCWLCINDANTDETTYLPAQLTYEGIDKDTNILTFRFQTHQGSYVVNYRWVEPLA